MEFHSVRSSKKGQATLLIVTVLCVVGTIVLMSSLDVFVRDYNHKAKDFNQVLLDETTSSAFAVMETALERRLWEPPPDSNCLRSEIMEVEGSTPDQVTWKVTAKFNFNTKNFEMTATGEYKNLTSTFKKKIKVMDVSDYLLLSTNDNPVSLNRLYSARAPSALIARDRRIYTKGYLKMGSALARPNSNTDFSGSAGSWPADWGTIVQGDRMQFGSGIIYEPYVVPKPNPVEGTHFINLLSPYSNAYGAAQTHRSQWGGGATVFTRDYNKAIELKRMVSDGTAVGSVTKASVAAEVYPIALFGGTPPLTAWNAADNGTYFNDVDRQSIFYYSWAEGNNFGVRIDATCFSRMDAATTNKYCSYSEAFPRGFKAWRTNAGLDGYLFTADAVAVPSPTISWDNLKALEEDANTCGSVVSAPINPVTDCPVWDSNFLSQYAAAGSTTGCQSVSTIDLDTISINSFNPTILADPANAGRLLRRVIYVKGPATFTQTNAAGLMLTALPANAARKNLSVWLVSEDRINLQGYQPDQTSPLTTRPEVMREITFNGDTTGAGTLKEPLALTVLTPERVNLLSPFYVPMTPAHLTKIWPASAGAIRPIRHSMTDWERQEDDGFKYGYRRYIINGMSLISSSKTSSGQPFFLQGLWSAPDSSANQFVSNQCMVSRSGQVNAKYPGVELRHTAYIPANHSSSDSPIPPLGSRYYGGLTDRFPYSYVPEVFWAQRNATGEQREQTEIVLNGITMSTEFSNVTPTGKRDISTPLYQPLEGRTAGLPFSLAHKNMGWDGTSYYKAQPAGTACLPQSAEFITVVGSADPYDYSAVQPSTNNGRQVFTQIAPGVDYRNVGSVVGIDQLVIETKGDASE